MNVTPQRAALIVIISIALSSSLSIGILRVFRDAVLPKVQQEVVTTVVKDSNEQLDVLTLGAVRERVQPGVFPIVHRTADGIIDTEKATRVALGLTSDGYVLTPLPVPPDAVFVLPGSIHVSAKEIWKDEKLGMALVKVQADHLPVIRFGASAFVLAGTDVRVVSALGIERTTVIGPVTPDDRRVVGANELLRRFLVPSKTAIVGSPVADGESVIGIVMDPAQGIAIPSDAFTPMMTRFLKTKLVTHVVLGMDVMQNERAAIVKVVRKGSLADTAGLKVGDEILSVEGESIQPQKTLSELLEPYDPATSVNMNLMRGKNEVTLPVPLE